jgi:membrane protein implicated in regulation of membrane protease activity
MPWWMWLLLGLLLSALELLNPGGFYIIFFGFSALLIGTLKLAGYAGPVWIQWLLFSLLSIALLMIFRSPLMRVLKVSDQPVDPLVGDIAMPVADIPPGEVGRAELRGAGWNARNVHGVTLMKGQRCRVQRVDGLMIYLVPE